MQLFFSFSPHFYSYGKEYYSLIEKLFSSYNNVPNFSNFAVFYGKKLNWMTSNSTFSPMWVGILLCKMKYQNYHYRSFMYVGGSHIKCFLYAAQNWLLNGAKCRNDQLFRTFSEYQSSRLSKYYRDTTFLYFRPIQLLLTNGQYSLYLLHYLPNVLYHVPVLPTTDFLTKRSLVN